jgi:hypothetical protein
VTDVSMNSSSSRKPPPAGGRAAAAGPDWLAAAVALAAFVAGFGVADLTGVRPLGGAVLLLGGAYCFTRVRAAAGARRASAVLMFAVVAFVFSHPLGDLLGAWPAVLAVATVVSLAVARASSA